MANNDYIEALLEENLKAQDRTTHAVRAIASFFLIQIAYAIVAGFLIALGLLLAENPAVAAFWAIVASLLLVAGFVHAFTRALIELEASKAPAFVTLDRTQPKHFAAENSAPYLARDWASAPVSRLDWEVLQRLAADEIDAWNERGRPSLEAWVEAGSPDFMEWLSKQKR